MPDRNPDKAARWDALRARGMSPAEATAAVEREWATRATQWDALTSQGMAPDSATALVERFSNTDTAQRVLSGSPWDLVRAAETARPGVSTDVSRLPTIPERRAEARRAGRPLRLGSPSGEQTVMPAARAEMIDVARRMPAVGRGLVRTARLGAMAMARAFGDEEAVANLEQLMQETSQQQPQGGIGGFVEGAVPFVVAAAGAEALLPSLGAATVGVELPVILKAVYNALRAPAIFGLAGAAEPIAAGESHDVVQRAFYLNAAFGIPFGFMEAAAPGIVKAVAQRRIAGARNAAEQTAYVEDAARHEAMGQQITDFINSQEAKRALKENALLGGTAEQEAANLAGRQTAFDAALAPARAQQARNVGAEAEVAAIGGRTIEPEVLRPGGPTTGNVSTPQPGMVDFTPSPIALTVADEMARMSGQGASSVKRGFTPLRNQPGFGAAAVLTPLAGAAAGGTAAAIASPEYATPTERIALIAAGAAAGLMGGAAIEGALARRARPQPPPTMAPPTLRRSAVIERRGQVATPTAPEAGLWPTGRTVLENGEAVRIDAYIRPEKLGMTTPEQVARVNAVGGEAIQAARARGVDWRSPITNAETEELAARLALKPNDVLRRPAERLTHGEHEALKILLRRSDDQIATLSRQMGEPGLSAGQMVDLEAAWDQAWADYRTIFTHASTARSEAGRALQIWNHVARDLTDPLVWMRMAGKAKGGPLTTAEMQRIRLIGEQGDPRKLVAAVAALAPGQRWAQFATLIKMGYLSKPSTHVRNVGSNAINVAFRAAADIPATLADAALSTMTGQSTKSFGGIFDAARLGAREGVAAARKAWREGASAETLAGWDLAGRGQFENPLVERYVEVIGRSLDAEDQFFRRIAFQRAIHEEAYSLARTAGLRGEAARIEAARLLKAPTEEMVSVAAGAAEEAVYRQVTPLHTVFQGAKAAARRAGHHKTVAFLETAVAPFTRTPLAVGATALNYSPFGVIRAFGEDLPKLVLSTMRHETAAVRNAQRVFVERASRGLMGSATLVYVGYRLRSAGLMTGAYPTNPSERAQWEVEGKTAYSVRFMGEWRSMVGFAPFGTLLAMGASYHDARQFQAEGEETKALRALGGAVATITEQPALQGMRRTFEASTDIFGAGARYAQGQAGSVVPGFVGAAAQTIDPVRRRPETALQAFTARIPFASRSVPARPNVFGEPIVREGSLASRGVRAFVDPFASSPDRTLHDPLLREMQRVGVNLSRLTPRPEETPEQFRAREQRVGQARRMALEDLYKNDDEYQDRARLTRDARWLIANDPRYAKMNVEQAVRQQQGELMRYTDRVVRLTAGEPPE